jgi:hypothetical protein
MFMKQSKVILYLLTSNNIIEVITGEKSTFGGSQKVTNPMATFQFKIVEACNFWNAIEILCLK